MVQGVILVMVALAQTMIVLALSGLNGVVGASRGPDRRAVEDDR